MALSIDKYREANSGSSKRTSTWLYSKMVEVIEISHMDVNTTSVDKALQGGGQDSRIAGAQAEAKEKAKKDEKPEKKPKETKKDKLDKHENQKRKRNSRHRQTNQNKKQMLMQLQPQKAKAKGKETRKVKGINQSSQKSRKANSRACTSHTIVAPEAKTASSCMTKGICTKVQSLA